jgi:hypothetical protein
MGRKCYWAEGGPVGLAQLAQRVRPGWSSGKSSLVPLGFDPRVGLVSRAFNWTSVGRWAALGPHRPDLDLQQGMLATARLPGARRAPAPACLPAAATRPALSLGCLGCKTNRCAATSLTSHTPSHRSIQGSANSRLGRLVASTRVARGIALACARKSATLWLGAGVRPARP